jgi:hypothetical protein
MCLLWNIDKYDRGSSWFVSASPGKRREIDFIRPRLLFFFRKYLKFLIRQLISFHTCSIFQHLKCPSFDRFFPVTFPAMQLNSMAFSWVLFKFHSFLSQSSPHFSCPIFRLFRNEYQVAHPHETKNRTAVFYILLLRSYKRRPTGNHTLTAR